MSPPIVSGVLVSVAIPPLGQPYADDTRRAKTTPPPRVGRRGGGGVRSGSCYSTPQTSSVATTSAAIFSMARRNITGVTERFSTGSAIIRLLLLVM